MSAAAALAQGNGQNTKKVVAFGGTGKTVALIYLKLGKLLGEQANIVVCDFASSLFHVGRRAGLSSPAPK